MDHIQQIVIPTFGDAEVLELQTGTVKPPSEGEVVVEVAFAGVNPIDVKTRAGLGWAAEQNGDKLPWVPGYDIAGKVIAVGDSVTELEIGDNVAGMIGFPLVAGGYSQKVTVSSSELSKVPDAIILEAAAALPLAGQTAVQAINHAQIKAGDRVLILAGAGGVGHIAVQLAIAAQAEVYTTCSEKNLDYLATLGAHAINYEFSAVSERLTDVDVLIDLVGGVSALDALKCLTDNARVVTVPTVTADLINEKAKLLGFQSQGMLVEPQVEQVDTLLYMVSVGLLKTEIQSVYSFKEVAKAHRAVESGHTRGKILLDMQAK
jgi:NADPH2:quinone reductase